MSQTTVENLRSFMNRCQDKYYASANNLANANTPGFKRMLLLEREGVTQSYVDPSPGPKIVTGNHLDVAITGEGYFAVMTRNGVRYTRAGNFQLNERRELVTTRGEQVLNDQGRPIIIDEGASINEDGTVYSGQQPAGRLAVVVPVNPAAVTAQGNALANFAPRIPDRGSYSIKSGILEESNVDVLTGMNDVIELMRTFEMGQRILKMNQNLSERSATEIGNTNR